MMTHSFVSEVNSLWILEQGLRTNLSSLRNYEVLLGSSVTSYKQVTRFYYIFGLELVIW